MASSTTRSSSDSSETSHPGINEGNIESFQYILIQCSVVFITRDLRSENNGRQQSSFYKAVLVQEYGVDIFVKYIVHDILSFEFMITSSSK